MNNIDRELAAVKEHIITLERRIAALEKQLDEVATQPTIDNELSATIRKYSPYVVKMFLISSAVFCLLLIVIMLIAGAIV